ncbi:hypothetical protein FOXG_19036 [Fusarium oxysporum f. sp. lycopersici 4287]|uniref:Uncharacterized protein n=3 Tax=Fusarium oxysporum TaxID=5507 RepID=A0A0J9UU69_FUSO4|nr:hypothetical protein FOXG_19036 [Fusarium oxysporum f. sp. lycopersici 4287]XP_018240494.1 hypothetical protein FOXG_19036 [Fusarium oxysporum f. sp. lycopersici 4287]EXK39393.1 hypothetical protein FOMG_06717 [Fusarium oxysporum f. sp. melonis 26406]EXK39394.1 hypothetical protein FOMG_06717 [Fusarium oxysporum f. sp. melonis 26406]KNB02448.1 hypothetical protein FOXG_19036 [Fusarium oxysporum f. sp. lycopersici 4287]KNB02449.1 hypothetical protein FOXG_19036 [Fusarium oxysporum f. sp. lyc
MSYGYGYDYYPGSRTQIDWGHVQFSDFSNVQYSRPDFSDAEDDPGKDEYEGGYTQQSLMRVPTAPTPSQPPSKKDKKKLKKQKEKAAAAAAAEAAFVLPPAPDPPAAPAPAPAPAPADDESPAATTHSKKKNKKSRKKEKESKSLPVPPPVPVPPPPTAEESKEAGKVEEEAKEETEGPELTGTQDTTNNEDSPAVGEEVVETETTSEEMASKNDEEKEEAPKDTDGKETPKEQTSPEEASQREDPPSTETSAAKADETTVKEEAPAQEGAPKEEGEAPQPEDPADDTPKDEPASEEGTSGEKSAVETPELEDPAIETPKDDTPTADEVLVKEDAPAPEETLEEPTPTEKATEDSSATDPPKEDFPATKETPSKEGVPEAEEASTGEEPPAKDQTSVEPETSGAPDKDDDGDDKLTAAAETRSPNKSQKKKKKEKEKKEKEKKEKEEKKKAAAKAEKSHHHKSKHSRSSSKDANNSKDVTVDPSKAIEDEEGERSVTAVPAEKSNDPELGVDSKLADETPPSAEEAAPFQGAKSGEEPQPSEDAKTAGEVTPAEEVKPEDEAPVEDPNPTEETPVSESTPIEETLTAEAKSAKEASPTEEAKPTDEAPVEDPQPTEETPTEEVKSVEAASSTEEVKPTDDTPVEDPKPTEETSTEEASSIEGANPVVEGSAEEPKLTEEIQAEEANPEENSKHTDESPAGGTVAESEVEHSPAEDTLSSSEDLGPAKEPTTEGDPKPEAKSAGEIPVEDKALQSEVEPQPANETSSSPPHPPSDSELNHAGEVSAEEEGPVPDPTPALSTEEAAPEAAKVDEGSKTAEAAEISRAMSDSSDDKAAEGNEVTTPVAALESDTTAGDEAAVAATKPTAESEDDLVPGDTSPVEAGVDAAAKETPAEDSVAEMASKAVAGEKDESISEGTLSPEDAGDNKEPVKSEETAPGEKEATDITTAIGVDDKPVETEVPAVPVDTEVSSGGNESPPEEAEELGDGKAPSPPETEVASPDGKETSVPEDKPSGEDQVIDAKSAEVLGLQAEITQDESPKEEISKEEASEATKPTEEAAAVEDTTATTAKKNKKKKKKKGGKSGVATPQPEPEPEPAVESAAAKADSFEPEVGSSTEPATEEDVKPESAIEPEVDFVSEPKAVSKAKVESPIEPHEIPPENETEPKASPQEPLPVELSPADDPEANHETVEAEGSCESEIAKPADFGEEVANETEATVVTTTSGAIPETTMEPTEKSEEAIDTTAKAGSDVERGYMISPEAEDASTKQETQKAEPDAKPTKDAPTDNPSNKELDASETETKNGESTEHNSIVDESKLGSVPIAETTPAEASQDDNSDKVESGEPAAADLKTEQAGVTLESGSSSDDVPDRQLDPAESKTSEIGETQEESSKPQEKENEQPDATTENPKEAAEPESTVSPDTNATVKDAEPEDAATEAKGDSLAEKNEPEAASKEADNSDNPPEVTTQPPEDGMDTKSDLMAETIVQEPAAVEMDKPVVTEGEVIGPLATEPKDESPVPDISTKEVGEPDTPTGDATEPLPAEKSTDDTEKESSDVVAEKAPKTADETIEVPEVNAETPGGKSEELNPHEGDTSNEAALEPAAADTPEPAADKDPELETPNETIDAQGDPEENHKDSSTPSVSNFDEAKAEVNIEDGETRSPEVEVTQKEDVEEVTQNISTGGTEATKEAEGTSESTPDENDNQTREPAIPTEDDTTSVESTSTSKEEPSASEKPVTEERTDPVEETPSSNEKVENESALSVSNPDQDESALNDKEQDAPQPAQQAADGASVSDNDPKEVTPAAGEAGTTDETVPTRPEEVEDRTPEETQAAGTLTNGHETDGASEASDKKEAETETGPQALEPVGVENDAITKGEHPEEASEAVVDHKDKDKSSDTATDLPNEAPDDEPAEPATDAVTQTSEEEPGTGAPEAEDGTKEETNPAGEVSAVDTLTTDDKPVEAAEAIDNETSDDKSEEKAGPSDTKLAPEVSTGHEPKEEEPTKETPAEKPTAVGESQEAEPVTESSSQESKAEAEAGAEAEIKPSEEKAAPEDQPAEGALAAQDEPEKGSETADSKPEEEATLVEDKQLEDPSASEKPDQDGKTAEEDPAAAAVAEDDPKQATPADAQEETNQITAGGTVEELPTPEDTAAPEEISAQEQIPAATGDAVSSDVRPADDSKVSQDETKPETQEPLAPEEEARPAEEVAPEPEGVTAKSPDEPIDEPPAEGEKKDDQPVKDTAEEEAKAKEDEESKDTLGPIPSNKRQAKKGEEHGSLHDTPIDFAQHLGVFTELNEEVGNGVLEFDSDDTQHHQGIPHNEENTALETIIHHPSQLPVAVASGDQNNQTLAETTMPGSQEPSSGEKRSNAAAEDNSAPLESKAEILDDVQENLISGHVPQPGLTPLSTPIDLDATDDTGLAASPPATEAHDSTKISTPDAPHEQGLAGQSWSAVRGFATERPVNISLQDPISIAEPQPQQPGTESETHVEESQSKPAQDAHDENEKSRIMEPDLPFIVARSTSSSPAASVISDEDSETSVPSHTAASELHRQPLEIQDPASRVEAEADKPSPGLLQPIPTPEPSSHEPKILETDFDNVLQTSRELTQDPAMRRAEPEGQEKEESDISEAESVDNDVSTLEEHMQELATPSHVRESEPSEVAKATEAQENAKIPDEATQPSKRGLTEETTLGELEDSDSISRDSSPDEALGIKSGPGDRPSASTDAEPVDISQKAIASDEDSDDDISSLDQQSVASRSNSIDQAISLEGHQNRQVQAEPVSPGVDEPATALHLEPIKLEDPAEEISDLDDSGSEDDSEDDNSEASPKFEPQPATGISLTGDSVQESNEPVIERQPIPPVLVSSTLIKEDVSDSDENDSEPEHDSLSSRAQDGPREDLRVGAHALALGDDDEGEDEDENEDGDESDVDQTHIVHKANSPKLEPSSVLQTTGARRGSPSNDEEPSEPLEPTDPNLAVVDEQPKDNPDRAIDQSEELDLSDSASSLSMATDIQKGVVSSDQPQPNSPHHGLPHPEPETAIPELAITAQTGTSSEAKSSVNLSRSSSPGSVDEEQLDSTAVPRKPLEHSDADSESEVEGTENEAKTEPSSLPQTVPGKDDSNFATGDEPEHRGISVAAVSVVQPNHGYLDSEKMLETPRTVQGRGLQDKHESLEKVLGVELPAASDDGLQIESRSIASSTDDEVDRKATATAATDDESNDDLPASREISPIGIDRISAPHQPEVVEQPALEAETSQAKNARVDGTDIEVMPPHETENIGTRRTTPEIPEWPDNEPEGDRPVHRAESQGPPALTYATSSGTMRGVEDEFRALNERSPDEEQIHNYTTFVGLRDQRSPSVERPHQDLSDHMLHEVKTPDTDDTQGSEPKPVQAAEVKPLELVRPEHMAVKVVDIPSRDKGKAVASIPESPKRSSSASRSTRLSRAEPPRTFLTQQQRPRRSLRVRPVTEVYTKDPIFIPAASRPVDTKPIQRPQPPRAESEPANVPVRPPLVHRSLELQGDPSTTAVRSEKAPRPRSFQAEGESSTGHVRHDLRHPAVTIEEGLRDAAYRAAPSAGSTVEAEVQRSPSPGIVIPDADMIDLQRARTLRRTRKTSIRRAEDTLAAAVVIYATAEALSPPGSPSPFIYQRNGGLPNLEHQMDAEPNDYNFPAVSPSLRSFDDEIEELHKSNADLFTDDRSRESDSSRSDRDRDRHRRRRHSHHSNRSGGSRGEEDRERRYRGDDERRAHRPREEDEGRHRRLSHREGESRYRRHGEEDETQARDSRGEADAKQRSSRGPEESRTRGYRRDEDSRPREYRRAEEPTSRAPPPQEDEGRERRRRSSGTHPYRRHRSDTVESGPPGTPPRTPRRDSGFSADNSSGSSGRKRRAPEEQAAHDKRRAERAERRAREEASGRREPSGYREEKESKGKEPVREQEPEPQPQPQPQPEPEPDRRHRRSRRHSNSERPRYEEPRERPREESVPPAPVPEKKFFAVKNSEGVLGSTTPPREEPVIAEPVRERTREAPLEDSPKRSSTRHRRTRPSTDEPRPRSSRRPREEPAPEPTRDRDRERERNREKSKTRDRDRDREQEPRPVKHVRMDTEDSRRKARHEERRRAQMREEDKKPSGIKGAFKKLFSKS